MWDTYTWQSPSVFIGDKPILTSEMMLHKDYDSKGSAKKKTFLVSQDELIGGKSPVVK
jgi:hypothetical protein